MTYFSHDLSLNDDIHDCAQSRVVEPNNCYLLMKEDRFRKEMSASNKDAQRAGWKNPSQIPPIVYNEELKYRIVTRVKENEQHE